MNGMYGRRLAPLAVAVLIGVIASSGASAQSMLERNVSNLLPRYGFTDVDTGALTTNQLTAISLTLSSPDLTQTDKVQRVASVLSKG
jgi:hypothetical protein